MYLAKNSLDACCVLLKSSSLSENYFCFCESFLSFYRCLSPALIPSVVPVKREQILFRIVSVYVYRPQPRYLEFNRRTAESQKSYVHLSDRRGMSGTHIFWLRFTRTLLLPPAAGDCWMVKLQCALGSWPDCLLSFIIFYAKQHKRNHGLEIVICNCWEKQLCKFKF